ncbi:MAG: HAD family hydrolase [Prevotella sp.]|nr:HAD family hydrolase [Prevotella sp.]
MRIKAVILDFDGTMGDTQDLIVRTMQQTIQQLGLPSRTDEQCAAMIGLPLKHTFTTLIEMSEEMGERCAELYRRLFNENNVPGAVPVFPNVLDTVRTLYERGLILTIASARRRDTLVEFLESMNLMQYIPYVISASDIENAKPAPDMVLKTLEDYHLSADEAIVVGDTKYDIEMAHRAGVKAVGVTYGNGTVEELRAYGAEYIIDDFAQLLDIVQ